MLFLQRPDIPADVEGFLTKLIQQCWNDDPEVYTANSLIMCILNSLGTVTVGATIICGESKGLEASSSRCVLRKARYTCVPIFICIIM